MGFVFGMLTSGSLDLNITMYSLCIVICFICMFEFVTGVLEYSLEDHPLYNRMVQNIYKELMQMGLISFVIVLIEANQHVDHTWFLAIDFAHMLLFFVALFFVVHAFYLMFLSYRSSKYHLKLNIQSLGTLLHNFKHKNKWETFLFWVPLFSLSQLQDTMEYKIAHVLFRDTYYRLPREFNFSLYLTKCLDHYALKTMEVGLFSWIFVGILVVANFVRVYLDGPFSCMRSPYLESYARRQLSAESARQTFNEHTAASGGHSSEEDHSTESNRECPLMYLHMFSATAVLLVLYILIVLFVGRLYKARWVHT
jgi:hypothetical protein